MKNIFIKKIFFIYVDGKIKQYNNFYFNTNCLSNGKFFGTIQKANNNILILTKLILVNIQFFPTYKYKYFI